MERPIENHLNLAELDELIASAVERLGGVASQAAPAELRQHLEGCESCRERLLEMERTIERLNELRAVESHIPSGDCPPLSVWPAVIVGQIDPATARTHLNHASQCAYCGERLRDATEDLLPELTEEERAMVASLPSSTLAGQQELSEKLAHQAGAHVTVVELPGAARRYTPRFRWWTAAAACLAMAAAGSVLYYRHLDSPEVLLAAAYDESRTVEFRIPGGSYGPLRVQRGGSGSASPALLAAGAIIARHLAEDPGDAIWIEAGARAALLGWQYHDTIDLAERALSLRPNWTPALLDLGEAYFERAETEGSPADYEASISQFSAVLASAPHDTVALFNRALAHGKSRHWNEARADWDAYLRLDSSSRWADEAKRQSAAIPKQP